MKRVRIIAYLSLFAFLFILAACGKTYKVTFMLDDRVYLEENVNSSNTTTKPVDPIKEGHTFVAWVDDKGNEWNFSDNKIESDTTLYAKCTRNTYTVVLDGTERKEYKVLYEDSLELPTYENTKDRVFDGWEDSSHQLYKGKIIVKYDVVLSPSYSNKKITLDYNGATNSGDKFIEVETGKSVSLPVDITKEDCKFLGWKSEDGILYNNSFVYEYDGNITLKAEYEYVYRYEKVNYTAVVTEYIGDKDKLTIPDEIDGYSVVEIKNTLLKNTAFKIKELSIPSSVCAVENGILEGQDEFEKLVCSSNISSYSNLKRLFNAAYSDEIPASFQKIEFIDFLDDISNFMLGLNNRKFDLIIPNYTENLRIDTDYVRSIVIEKNTSKILVDGATWGSEKFLENLYLNGDISDFCRIEHSVVSIKNIYIEDDNGTIEYENNKYKLLENKITIPSNVTVLKDYAFYEYDKITEVKFDGNITKLGSSSFANCKNLVKVEIPNTVTEIGGGLFYNCINLETANLPNKIKIVPEKTFYQCYKLKEIYIPDSVETICDYAFYFCTSLKSINLPESLKKIGTFWYACFYGCFKIIELYNLSVLEIAIEGQSKIFDAVKVVHTSKNERSSLVKDENGYVFCYSQGKGYLVDYEGKEENIKLPDYFYYDGTKVNNYVINDMAFACKDIKTVTISSSVTAIYSAAFYKCTKLYKAIIPDSVKHISGNFSTSDGYGSYIFYDCINLMEVYIPKIDSQYSWDGYMSEISDNLPDVYISDKGKIITPNDSKPESILTEEGYYFRKDNDKWYLLAYVGDENELYLPNKFVTGSNGEIVDEYGIGNYCFFYSQADSIIVPSSVNEIKNYAFIFGNDNKRISIPLSVVNVGDLLFTLGSNHIGYVIEYEGTISQWDSLFGNHTYMSKLICSDGVIENKI